MSSFSLPSEAMGKRSGFLVVVVLAGALAQLTLRVASAQVSTSGSGSSDCGSGIYSSVDGNCLGADQSLGGDQLGSGFGTQQNGSVYGSGSGSGSGGLGLPAGQLGQQYPGLQSQGMNSRVPNFYDQSGLPLSQAERQALVQERALAVLNQSPPTEFQRLVRASWGSMLPVYGDSLFQVVPSTFAPVRQIPIPSDYVLGPDDQLVIRIWGQVNFNSELTVDRSGAVYLPQVGSIHVAGLPYSQLEQHLHDAVARIYKNFNLEVELGQLRAIQVFVVGQARRPGTYTLSSLSTLVTAIFATGGPSVQGSLRDIQVRRNGQTVTHFDLYDLLINGDKSKDVPLMPADVVYIPPVGAQVAVAGSVRYPAIYELKGATAVSQVLQFAGGLATTASVLRASLERIDAHKDRSVVDIALTGAGLETPLSEGDILRILPISPQFQDTVTLRGNVAEEGRFSWHPGMKLSEIIPDSQSLITRDYWERRNQLGIPGPEFKAEYVTNPELYPRVPETSGAPSGSNATQGVGLNAGGQTIPTQINSEGALDLNGVQAQQTLQNAENSQTAQTAQQSGQSNAATGDTAGNGALSNEVQTPSRGTPPPRPPLNIELPVPEIDWSYAVIERLNPQTLTTSLVPFNPGKLVLEHDASQDLLLQPGDVVTVFSQEDIRVPQAQRTKFVRLEGEFKQAGIYSVLPGETLRDLVARAGGFTPAAYLFGSDFMRESTRVIQQQRLDTYLQQLEIAIDRQTVANNAGAVSPLGAAAAASGTAAAQTLIAKFRTLRASGRIVLNMPPNASELQNVPDMPLEDGDRFTVPSKPNTVNVVGAVYNENAFLFQRTQGVGAYLKLAGGADRDADGAHAYIIRADGSVVSRKSQSGVFGNTFDSTRLYAGDTIVVPEKVPKPSALVNLSNYTGIFSQLALGAAAIAVLK
jgi:protein involved in polysaccharide export with SLBB domain